MEPKYRKKLNQEQLTVLELLHKFRFASNDLIAQYFGKKDRSFAFKRLKILQEQGYIAKRFDDSYRLRAKPAAYYLMPAGARQLRVLNPNISIKNLYKNPTASERLVEDSLDLFGVHNVLRSLYGVDLQFFTKSDLNREDFDYFPRPLPSAYVRIKTNTSEKQFFLDIYYDSEPFFAASQRIKQYIKYAESAAWEITNTRLPFILMVCESPNLRKRLHKQAFKIMQAEWNEEVVLALTDKNQLKNPSLPIWQLASEVSEVIGLEDIQ